MSERRIPFVAAAVVGLSLVIFALQYLYDPIVGYLALNPVSLAGNFGEVYRLATYSITNPFIVQLVYNSAALILAALVVEAKVSWPTALAGAVASSIVGGLAFLLYSRITGISSVYLGSATIAVGYIGMLLMLGLRDRSLHGWRKHQKVIFYILNGLLLLQFIASLIFGQLQTMTLVISYVGGITVVVAASFWSRAKMRSSST